jgi:elongator complex protein 3
MKDAREARAAWCRARSLEDPVRYADQGLAILTEIRSAPRPSAEGVRTILRRHPRDGSNLFSKNFLVRVYHHLCAEGRLEPDPATLRLLQRKPVRTLSGVAPVTVLTKPHPCPGKCVFCPTDARMPKSYLPDEPGAQRAEQHAFDPHAQVAGRIASFHTNGHAVDKIELLILGGTWSSYPRSYQEWFVRRCLDAMNGREALSLAEAQRWNETARHRNVGLVIETRPDHVKPGEIRWLRTLGVTKVQMGAQSLDDDILLRNQRGHDVETTRRAVTLLRAAGFKVVLHWMPNLLGSSPERDLADFARLWGDVALRPDEIKIYPCSLLADAELADHWRRGEYEPYDDATLIELVARCKERVPPYGRINRVYRDIPSTEILAGCKISNLRQEAHRHLAERGRRCRCIRCREIRSGTVRWRDLIPGEHTYETRESVERFLSYDTVEGRLAGYARLSLPSGRVDPGLEELRGAALIREVHVYGPALALGHSGNGRSGNGLSDSGDSGGGGSGAGGEAQHRGLGTRLLARAETIAREAGYPRMAIIASVGTRPYYERRGYSLEGTYMTRSLDRPAQVGSAGGDPAAQVR